MKPDIAHVRVLLAAHDPHGDLVRISRPRTGISNHVLYLTTTREELVLRVFADDVARWKPHKELALSTHMASLGIPVPSIRAVDVSGQGVLFAYSLSARLKGEPWSTVCASLSDAANSAIHITLGDYLGRMHATTFDRFGDVYAAADGLSVGPANELDTGAPDQPLGPFATWREMHDAIVRSRLHLMRCTAFEDLIPVAEAYFARHQDEIDVEIVPRLLHMDLHRGNVLVADGQVSGVLDVEDSVVGHNEYDLMRTELANFRGQPPAFARAFMDAYGAHVHLDEDYARRKEFYDVSRTLAWIRSLILSGDAGARGPSSQSHHAAREHFHSLTVDR